MLPRSTLEIVSIPVGGLQAIKTEIGMTNGQQTCYDLLAATNAGRKIKLAGGIREKREAQWLDERISAELKRSASP